MNRRQSIKNSKARIAGLIARALAEYRAGVCDDDRTVVKVYTSIEHEYRGEHVSESVEFEVHIRELMA